MIFFLFKKRKKCLLSRFNLFSMDNSYMVQSYSEKHFVFDQNMFAKILRNNLSLNLYQKTKTQKWLVFEEKLQKQADI